MRLLCPFCQQTLTLPDDQAGKAVNCPHCSQAFQAPQPYIPLAADPPAAPAPATHPAVAGPPLRTQAVDITPVSSAPSFDNLPMLPGVPAGPGTFRGLTLRPEVLAWVPAVALTIALILTFCRWAGSYPAGYPAYTQNGWLALFASFSSDAVAEDMLKMEGKIQEKIKTNWWLMFYFPLLIFGVVVAWAGPVVSVLKLKLPAFAQKLWPYRPALAAVFAVFTLLLLSVQWANGFGIERAITELAEAEFAESKAAANTPEKLQRWEMRTSAAVASMQLRTTSWLRLSWLAHLLAALAVGLEAVTALRGHRPPIRVGVSA